jgi:hypothetical protein
MRTWVWTKKNEKGKKVFLADRQEIEEVLRRPKLFACKSIRELCLSRGKTIISSSSTEREGKRLPV